MSAQPIKTKSLKDSILEKLPAKKQQKILKGYGLGKRYLKAPPKDLKEVSVYPEATVIDKSMQTEENTPNETLNEPEIISGYLNPPNLEWNKSEDIKSVTIPTDDLGNTKTRTDAPNFQPAVEKVSVGIGEANVYRNLTTTTLEPVDILIEKKVPVKRRDSVIKKAMDKSIMTGSQPGLPIGTDVGNQWYDNKSWDLLTEEAISVSNSLCAELCGVGNRGELRRGKSVEIVRSMSNSESLMRTVTESSELRALKQQAIANNKEIYSKRCVNSDNNVRH